MLLKEYMEKVRSGEIKPAPMKPSKEEEDKFFRMIDSVLNGDLPAAVKHAEKIFGGKL